MKKTIYTLAALCILASCGNNGEKEKTVEIDTVVTITNNTNTTGELWADGIRTQSDIIKPVEWSEEDWKSVNKFIDNKKIVSTILDAVLSGKQKAYSVIDDSTELSIDEVKTIIASKAGDKQPVDVIDNIRLKESWYFDTASFSMHHKVHAICPCKKHFGENGEFQGYEPMFWVRTN